MIISVDELATKAMSLSGEARALLAERLVESLDQESVIISDCWIEPSFRKSDVYADALRSVLPLVHEEGLQIWALCDGDNKAFQRAIEQAGFNKSKVIVSRRLVHWFAWSRIEAVDTP